MLRKPLIPERYYYAELCTNSKSILAYRDLSYRELQRAVKSYHKNLLNQENNHTIIFGNMKNIGQLGELGTDILKQAKPYRADIAYIVNNTLAWYLEHPEEDE